MHFSIAWAVRIGVFATVIGSAAFAADDLAPVFARMDQAAPKFKGMRAEMKKVSHTAAINVDETDLGSIVVKVPKPHEFHMLIDFQQPDKKAVEVVGTTVQMYYPKTNEVQIYNFGKGHKAEVEQFLKLGFGSTSKELRDAYTVTYGGPETVAGQAATRIVLVPKSPELAAQFPKF